MNNINRFQGQGHRLGGNQNLQEVRARQVQAANANLPQMPQQVANQVQQVAAQQVAAQQVAAQQVVPAVEVLAQQNMQAANLPPIPQIPPIPQDDDEIDLAELVANANLPEMPDVDREAVNQTIINFIQNMNQQNGELPNVVHLPEIDPNITAENLINNQDVPDLAGSVQYLQNFIKDVKSFSAQVLQALPDQDGEALIGDKIVTRQSNNIGATFQCEGAKVFVEPENVYFSYKQDGHDINAGFDLQDNTFSIYKDGIRFENSQDGKEVELIQNNVPVLNARNCNDGKKFYSGQFDNRAHYLMFNQDNELMQYNIAGGLWRYDGQERQLYINSFNNVQVINVPKNDKFFVRNIVLKDQLRQAIGDKRGEQVDFKGVNINVPSDLINQKGIMSEINNHLEIMSNSPNDNIIDIGSNGDRLEKLGNDWDQGYIYYDENNNELYEYNVNIDGQGTNKITKYYSDIHIPEYEIVTQADIKDLNQSTYKYTLQDKKQNLICQETMINNDVVETVCRNQGNDLAQVHIGYDVNKVLEQLNAL